jgi:hypothetical protein
MNTSNATCARIPATKSERERAVQFRCVRAFDGMLCEHNVMDCRRLGVVDKVKAGG